MSFICASCKTPSDDGEKPVRVVMEDRFKVYPYRAEANLVEIDGEKKWQADCGGEGREIAKEGLICPRCAQMGKTWGEIEAARKGIPVMKKVFAARRPATLTDGQARK